MKYVNHRGRHGAATVLAAVLAAAALLAAPAAMLAAAPTCSQDLERTLLFDRGQGGSQYYRIPAIATAPDGTVVVVADQRWESNKDLPGHIDVVCRRSPDGGRTWTDMATVAATDADGGYGDPALAVHRPSGTLVCVMTHGNGLWESTPDNHAHIVVARSTDNGATWTAPADITAMLFDPDSTATAPITAISAFATSGQMLCTRSGRLMFVLVARQAEKLWGPLSCYACYSDDGGITWHAALNAADREGDEAKVAELPDGTLLMSIRNRARLGRRLSLSTDGGLTWSAPTVNPALREPACNGDMIAYRHGGRDMLLHSLPYDSAARRNVTILGSDDNGATWQPLWTVCPTGSAYSSLAVLADGSVGCVSEEDANNGGFRLWFTRVPADLLMRNFTPTR